MPRARKEEDIHQEIVCRVGRNLYEQGYRVAVDGECDFPEEILLPTFPEELPGCEDTHSRRPDIYAVYGERIVIGEVETENTINDARTRCQLSIFPKYGETIVYVPDDCVEDMESNLDRWSIMDVQVEGY